ncbi:MAG TPA: hypothetical protein PKH03_04260 [Syntrophales bacterium]|nr:hypothetical protein [Syntrophales bacterium]
MKKLNQQGNILLFIVVGMTLIAVLGTGIYFATTTSTFSGVSANDHHRAYQLALAGRDYALAKNLSNMSGDFTFSNGDIFRLVVSGDTITSTGIVKSGTPYEVKRTVTITISGFSSQADVVFARNLADFTETIPQLQTQSGLVIENALGQIEMGQAKTLSFGGISYGGDASSGNCQNGICDFNGGFRAYFRFKLVKESSGEPHGFVFTFFHGYNSSTGVGNLSTAIGGDKGIGGAITNDMPELLGYAGSSCITRNSSGVCTSWLDGSGKGIQPPKMAIEFDAREHSCGSSGACYYSSRCDGSRNHMAYHFWGDSSTCGNRENSPTYDDNRHGSGTAGSATIPRNSVASNSADTEDYFTGYNQSPRWSSTWLYDPAQTFAVRVEVSRGSTPNSNGKYFYRTRTWIKKCVRSDGSACDISETDCCSYGNADFDNVKVDYNELHSTDLPTLDRTIELDSDNHTLFEKFAWGWRFAAGSGSPENVTISSFGIYFIKEPGSCVNYGVWNDLGGSGSTSYFKINGSGCIGVVKDSFIGNIGASEIIDGFTDAACTIAASPSSLSFSQASTADTNKNCAVYFSGTDK